MTSIWVCLSCLLLHLCLPLLSKRRQTHLQQKETDALAKSEFVREMNYGDDWMSGRRGRHDTHVGEWIRV
ncbi:hypothetical protein L596_019592 [Steinernema carpocapsae]|uniref:Gastrin/cholecystokinin peptide hormone domain-containing protein n=1 Tax=Steinernema carpocapsae TaxID=34508 RepID=A0A4U5MR47_STECR|nr:hypothetical protein L596_019592 [Steinernema carpocapsae]